MSNRGMIFLAVGMLLLGLILGGASGGVAGYFMGRNSVRAFGGQFNQPLSQNQAPAGPNTQPFNQNPGNNQPFNQNPGNNQPFNQIPGNNSGPRANPFAQGGVTGARVIDVQTSSPSEKAGLKLDDVITAVAGTKIDDTHALADLIKTHKPGEKVDLTVLRASQTVTVTIELGTSPTDSSAAYLGIQYAPVTAQSQGGRRQ